MQSKQHNASINILLTAKKFLKSLFKSSYLYQMHILSIIISYFKTTVLPTLKIVPL